MLNAAYGRPGADGHRACLLRQCLALDGEWSPEQAGCRAAFVLSRASAASAIIGSRPCWSRAMLESMKVVAAIEVPRPPSARGRQTTDALPVLPEVATITWPARAGVAVTDALVAMGHIMLTDEGGEVTASGGRFLCGVRR